MAITDTLPKEFVLDQPQSELPEGFVLDTEQPKNTTAGDILLMSGLGAGIGAAGMAGAKGASAIGKWWQEPRDVYQNYKSQLVNMQKGMGLEGTTLEFIPQRLAEQAKEVKEAGDIQLSNVDTQTQLKTLALDSAKQNVKQMTDLLKNQLESFDNNLISKSIEDLSMNIKTQYPQIFKDASLSYESGLQAIENHFIKSGAVLDTNNFINGFVDKTISQARQQGIPDENISSVFKLKKQFTPMIKSEGNLELIYNKKVAEALKRPMSFTQAKGLISDVIQQDPNSRLSAVMRNTWGEYLEDIAPKEIKADLANLNSNYRTFKNLQTQLINLSDPNTGEFNTKGLNKVLFDYVKTRRNEGIVDLMDYISKGSEMIKPVKGVKKKWSNLGQLLKKRFKLESNIQKMEETGGVIEKEILGSKGISLNARKSVETEIRQKLANIRALDNKYSIISDKLVAAGEKIPFRGKNIKQFVLGVGRVGAARALARTITPLAISTQFFDVLKFARDPEAYYIRTTTGGKLDRKEINTIRDIYQRFKQGKTISKSEEQGLIDVGIII